MDRQKDKEWKCIKRGELMFISKEEARMAELLNAIEVLRKKPELGEVCFRVYLPDEDINSCMSSLVEEAKKYGYRICFKSGNAGTKLGIIEYALEEYWN